MADVSDRDIAGPDRRGRLTGMATGGRRVPGSGDTIGRNGVLSLLALFVLGGTRVVYGSMVSRVTDHETYAMIGVLTAVTMIASFSFPAGVGAAITRFVPFSRGRGDPAVARGFYRLLQGIGLPVSIALGIAAGVGVSVFLDRRLEEAIEVGLLTVAYSVYTIEKAALYGFSRVDRYAGLELAASVVTLAATVIVIAVGSRLFLLPFILGYSVFVAGAQSTLRSDLRGEIARPATADRREALGFLALACAGTLASAGFLQGTQLLAVGFATPTEISYLTAAVTLVAPLYFLPRALGLALFPFMSRAHGSGDTDVIRRYADGATRGLLALLAPLFVAAALLSPELLAVFGGERYIAGAPVLQIILAAGYAAVVQVAAVNALSSGSGWQLRTPVGWSVAGCVVGLALVAVLGGPFGASGVALSYLVGTVVTAAGPMAVVWRRYRMAWSGPILRGGLSVGVAVAAAKLLSFADGASPGPPAVHIGVAMVGFAASIVVLRTDIVGVVRRSRRPFTTEGPNGELA